MDTDLKFEFKVDIKPVSHKSYRYRMAKIVHEPKLRQYLVLAYQIQDTLSEEKAKDLWQMGRSRMALLRKILTCFSS